MPIQIRYTLTNQKLYRAAVFANSLLSSTNMLDIIESRNRPFDESWPSDLSPHAVAQAFEHANMLLVLGEYTAKNSKIGGKFMTGKPYNIWANRLAIPKRSECGLAVMLVHECAHALSYSVRTTMRFSHCDNDDHKHRQTAPYWIQSNLRDKFCPGVLPDEDLLEVELIEGARFIAEEDEEVGMAEDESPRTDSSAV